MMSIDECWTFLESRVTGGSALPPGASENAIEEAEAAMGVAFPDDFRRHFLRHNGSGNNFISPYKIGGGGQALMSLDHIVRTWRTMIQIGESFEKDGEFGTQRESEDDTLGLLIETEDGEVLETGPIKRNYWNKKWIPFTDNQCGDHIFFDLDPSDLGNVGQIVDWWHEGGVSTFQSTSLQEWLNEVVDAIKNGVYTFGTE
jgi:cell wall assembly regulator SMI1